MAKDTSIIVRVPGFFNEILAEYIFLLQDIGITKSKAEVIIDMAVVGSKSMMAELKSECGKDER